MAIQTINIGNQVNDGLGDDLRTAFQKVNANFTTLENALSVTVSSTTGTNGYSVFKEQIGPNLVFKTISSGTKIRVDDAGDTIIINNTEPYAVTRIDTNAGRIQPDDANLGRITIQGGKDIDVTANGTVMTVNTVLPVTNILSTFEDDSFDYIIDDGPHTLASMVISAQKWIDKVKPSGKLIPCCANNSGAVTRL
jgi:hypothetical protein